MGFLAGRLAPVCSNAALRALRSRRCSGSLRLTACLPFLGARELTGTPRVGTLFHAGAAALNDRDADWQPNQRVEMAVTRAPAGIDSASRDRA